MLKETDQIPNHLSIDEIYHAIKNWYSSNVEKSISPESERFIANLPDVQFVTEEEKVITCIEVISGRLEWAFHMRDDLYKMGAYGLSGVIQSGITPFSNQMGEFIKLHSNKLQFSKLWPHISNHLKK